MIDEEMVVSVSKVIGCMPMVLCQEISYNKGTRMVHRSGVVHMGGAHTVIHGSQ